VHIEVEGVSDVWFKQRAVFEFLTAKKVPPIEIHRQMQDIYGDHCVDVSTVRRWVRRFKAGELGQADLSDKTQSGWISETWQKCVEVHGDFVEK